MPFPLYHSNDDAMSARRLAVAAMGVLATPAVLMGQLPRISGATNRAPGKNAVVIMIAPFRVESTARGTSRAGDLAADAMRRQVSDAFRSTELFVIPAERMAEHLRILGDHSAFSARIELGPHDVRPLAINFRADAYIEGEVMRTSAGHYRVQPDLVLTRDINAKQPLGVGESPKLDDAVKTLVKEMQRAHLQMDGERKCTNAARSGNYPEAIEFANAAIKAYPKATLARICLLSVLDVARAPRELVLQVARELVALDPRNEAGGRYLREAPVGSPQVDSTARR